METVKTAWFKDVKCAVGKHSLPFLICLLTLEIPMCSSNIVTRKRTKLGRGLSQAGTSLNILQKK